MKETLDNAELNSVKKDNEQLKTQIDQHSRAAQALLAQLDAHKCELADSRAISLQLRTRLVMAEKDLEQLHKKVKELEKPVPPPKE